MNLPLVLCVLLLSIDKGQCNHLNSELFSTTFIVTLTARMHAGSCGGVSDIGNIRLVEPRHTLNDGTVQICNVFMYRNNQLLSWCYLNSTKSWNVTAARVACRQLGLPHSGKQQT